MNLSELSHPLRMSSKRDETEREGLANCRRFQFAQESAAEVYAGPFDRSIDVHVSRIRAAIEDNPKKPRRVITVRGAGYVFAKAQD